MADFQIPGLFNKAFGYEMPESGYVLADADVRQEVSALGQPFYDTDVFGREFFMPVRLNGYLLYFPFVTITTKNTIIETAMVERPGTVKELINAEDWVISIKGLILRPDNVFPEKELQELEELRAICTKEAVEMRSAFTDIFLRGEDKVVLRSLTPSMIKGVEHAASYTMELVSDSPYDLEIA